MENNYCVGVEYKLYSINEKGERQLEEETNQGEPFRYLSGFSMTLDQFEKETIGLEVGDSFDFVINKDEAYGDYNEEAVLDLEKGMFEIDGKLDTQHIFVGAIIPLQNAEGQRFMAQVLEIGDSTVKVDLNHPLAGMTLNFVGKVTEKRVASAQEIQAMIAHMTGNGGGCGGCGGGCNGGNCGGDCGSDCNCEGGCNKG